MNATVVKKRGTTYVKVGKKLIKVSEKISERELIQWMIKHFHRRRKRKTSKAAPKATSVPSTSFSSFKVDENRIEAREALKKLEEANEKLKELKSSSSSSSHVAPPGNMISIDQVRYIAKEADKEVQKRLKSKDSEIQQKEADLLVHEDKLDRVKKKTEKLEEQLDVLEDIEKEMHKRKRQIEKAATTAVQKQISNYTVTDLRKIADDMSE